MRSVVAASRLDLGVPVLTATRGQIDLFAGDPVPTITGDGYVASLDDTVMSGATYAHAELEDDPVPQDEASVINAETMTRLSGRAPAARIAARAALRAATPDRHPLAGPVPDMSQFEATHAPLRHGGAPSAEPTAVSGLFVMSGLGSRGLVTAPLLGAYVTALLTGSTLPLPREVCAWLHPARFAARAMRRRLG